MQRALRDRLTIPAVEATTVLRMIDDLAGGRSHRRQPRAPWAEHESRSRRYVGHDDPTSAPTVHAARRGVADGGRNDPARSACETAGGRDDDADGLDRVRAGFASVRRFNAA